MKKILLNYYIINKKTFIYMILISHRGNTNGRLESYENQPSYIDLAIKKGYEVEVDIWVKDKIIYLGHDEPQYEVNLSFLKDRKDKIWAHSKNIDALLFLISNKIRCFFHDTDDCVLTSNNYIWTFPGKKLTNMSIAVMPEKSSYTIEELKKCYGICTDNVDMYRNILN